MPPTTSAQPPRRRLNRTNGDTIISIFEGSSEDHRIGGVVHVNSPNSNKNKNNKHAGEEDTQANEEEGEHHRQQQLQFEQEGNQQQEQAATSTTATSSQQTDTLSSEFQLFELVLNSAPKNGMVTREHAAHKAMLDRQLSQRIIDARLDERFNRQTIEDTWSDLMSASNTVFGFHAAAVRDVMCPQGRPAFVKMEDHEALKQERAKLIDKIDLLERRLAAKNDGIHFLTETKRFAPPPVSIASLERDEEICRNRLVELSDEMLNAWTTIFAAPKNAVLARRQQLYNQQFQTVGAKAKLIEAQEEGARNLILQQQQEEAQTSNLSPLLSSLLLGKKENEETGSGENNNNNNQMVFNTFRDMVQTLHRERELYRQHSDSLAIVAAEEAARQAFSDVCLYFTSEFIRAMQQESLIKTELTRKMRNSLKEQHEQMIRHKKDRAVTNNAASGHLPPVVHKATPKISSLPTRVEDLASVQQALAQNAISEARKAAAVVLKHSSSSSTNTISAAAAAATAAAAGVGGGASSARKPHPPPPSGSSQKSSLASTPNVNNKKSTGSSSSSSSSRLMSSYERAPLYNSGFSRYTSVK